MKGSMRSIGKDCTVWLLIMPFDSKSLKVELLAAHYKVDASTSIAVI